MNKTRIFSHLMALTFILQSAFAAAGTLSGEISFDKKPPFAGLLYADDGSVGNAHAVLDQKSKEFTQKLVVAGKGEAIAIHNSDDVDHNIFANDLQHNVNFDVGLMSPGTESNVDVNWKENVIVRVGCKIHPKMRSYIASVASQHYQVFEFEKGTQSYPVNIALADDDAKTFKLMIPKYDAVEISLAKGETKSVVISRKGKPRGNLTLSRS